MLQKRGTDSALPEQRKASGEGAGSALPRFFLPVDFPMLTDRSVDAFDQQTAMTVELATPRVGAFGGLGSAGFRQGDVV
ncbi:MAG: hypothetical protein U1F52_11145 [Burkholderiales bacterium]